MSPVQQKQYEPNPNNAEGGGGAKCSLLKRRVERISARPLLRESDRPLLRESDRPLLRESDD